MCASNFQIFAVNMLLFVLFHLQIIIFFTFSFPSKRTQRRLSKKSPGTINFIRYLNPPNENILSRILLAAQRIINCTNRVMQENTPNEIILSHIPLATQRIINCTNRVMQENTIDRIVKQMGECIEPNREES